MDAKATISIIRNDLTELRGSGREFVSIDALSEYLADLEGAATDSIELKRLKSASNLAHYRAVHETNLEMFKSVLEAGRTAVTSCILVNGGATVALLAYLGNYLSKNPAAERIPELAQGVVTFAVGVMLGAMATGTRYLSQGAFSHKWNPIGSVMNVISILLVFGAYVCFGFGIHAAYRAFS